MSIVVQLLAILVWAQGTLGMGLKGTSARYFSWDQLSPGPAAGALLNLNKKTNKKTEKNVTRHSWAPMTHQTDDAGVGRPWGLRWQRSLFGWKQNTLIQLPLCVITG